MLCLVEKPRRPSKEGSVNESVMTGMMSVMNNLCAAMTPKSTASQPRQWVLSTW